MADGGSKGSTTLPRVGIDGSRPDLPAPPVDSSLLFHGHQWRRPLSSSNSRSGCSVPQPGAQRRKIALASERSQYSACLVDLERKELQILFGQRGEARKVNFLTCTECSPHVGGI